VCLLFDVVQLLKVQKHQYLVQELVVIEQILHKSN
jgi:hypothetical protein